MIKHFEKLGMIDIDLINYEIGMLKSSREFTRPPPIRKEEVKELKKLSDWAHFAQFFQ